MKKILAYIIAVILLLSVIPSQTLSAEGKSEVVKDKVEYYGHTLNITENYIASEKTLLDSDGKELWKVSNENESIYTMTDNCIITVWVNGDTVDNAEYGFKLYSLDSGKVTFKSDFQNYPYVMHYDDGGYAVVIHIDILKMKREGIGYDGRSLTKLPLYGYDIIDEYGDVVYSETGKKAIRFFSGNSFCEIEGIEGVTDKYNVFKLTGGDVKKTQLSYTCYGLTEQGHCFVSYKAPGTSTTVRGVVDIVGEIIIPLNYTEVDFVNGYYLAKTDSYNTTDIFDIDGNELFYVDGEVRYFNGSIAITATRKSQGYGYSYQLVDVGDYTVITDAISISFGGGYFICNMGSGIKVYDGNGSLIFEKDQWEFVKLDEGDNTLIVYDPTAEVYYRLDSCFNITETLPGDVYVIFSYNGVSILDIKETGKHYLMYKGERISDNHGAAVISGNMPRIKGTEIFIFQNGGEADNDRYTLYLINSNKNPFYDVEVGNWASEYIRRCFDQGIMIGIGDNKFGPLVSVTRAQVVTTLWRLAGEPNEGISSGKNLSFTDVPEETWYTEAVAWAADEGITSGVGGGYFAPDRVITRGEVAALIYRYANVMGLDTAGRASLSTFTDHDTLTDWNRDAFSWCAAEGIISGKSKGDGSPVSLAPSDALTRSELAAILCRYGID
ncbi:MAG: S-layer homology domain-containing protein [Clostridia bacterium]|nr:S-layer homology domain-containing protein [Clostridia bacterium]